MLLQGILFIVGLGLATGCNDYQIVQCVNTFKSSGGEETIRTEQQLTTLCNSHFPTLKRCLAPYTIGCGLQLRSIYEGVTNLFEYVCNEGREDVVKYAGCLSRDSLLSDVKGCRSTMEYKIKSDPYASRETKCGYIDELLVCATDASKAECGAGAAAYGNKAMRLELGPLLETIGCDEDTGKEVIYVTKPVKPTPRAYERKTHAMKPIYDSSKHHSGGASTSAMMWIVGAALALQWFVR